MKEFELIAKIQREFSLNNRHKNLVVPIGDDCSVIRPPKGNPFRDNRIIAPPSRLARGRGKARQLL